MDLLLNVNRGDVDDEITPVLFIFPSPDQLRVEIPIPAFIGNSRGILGFFLNKGLTLCRRNVLPFFVIMDDCFYR